MKKVTTDRQGRPRYVAPLLELIDVRPEKGFAASDEYPGTGGIGTMSYDDFYLENE